MAGLVRLGCGQKDSGDGVDLKFTKETDTQHSIKLESRLVRAQWLAPCAFGGQTVTLEVCTEMVGMGAPVKIEGRSAKGKKLGKLKEKMSGNVLCAALDVPEDIKIGDEVYFTVELPKHSLRGESNRIPAYPPIKVANLKWSATEARRGDILKMAARVEGAPRGTEAVVTVYEYDRNGAPDKIVALPAEIVDERVEVQWEYEYYEDTDEIPTQEEMQKHGGKYNPPEYFFTVKVGEKEFGKKQESGLVEFRDWIEIELVGPTGQPSGNKEYSLRLPDGQERHGRLDSSGQVRVENLPPGEVTIEFPDLPGARARSEEEEA